MFGDPAPTDGVEAVEVRPGVWAFVLTIDGQKSNPIGRFPDQLKALSAGGQELNKRKPRR